MANSNPNAGKKYIHWKESQMVLLSEYLESHVEYAVSPSLEFCCIIKRDVFPDDDEVTPKRLFGKICNVKAAFRRSGGVFLKIKRLRDSNTNYDRNKRF